MASYDFSMHQTTIDELAVKPTTRGQSHHQRHHPAELLVAGFEEPEWEYLSDDGEDAFVVEELLKLEILLETSLKGLADTKGTATNGFDTLVETDSLDLVRAPRSQKPQEEEAQESSNKEQWTMDELEEEWTMPLAGEDDEDAQEEARQPPRRRTAWTSMVQRPPRRSSTRVCRHKNGVTTAPITSE